MLTIFAVPKAFKGHTGVIQRNAIRSWTLLSPRPEIILFGNDPGTGETAGELGLRHVPDVSINDSGTPLLDDIFSKAHRLASGEVLCYANADIILVSRFADAVRTVVEAMPRFLLIAKRWDLEVQDSLDFSGEWEKKLMEKVEASGKFLEEIFVDIFVFSRGIFEEIPPFAVGRAFWDNWLVYKARAANVPVIDATPFVKTVHQIHDYAHMGNKEAAFKGGSPEVERNLALAGGARYLFKLDDATHILSPSGLRSVSGAARLFSRVYRIPALRPGFSWIFDLFRSAWHVFPMKMRKKMLKRVKPRG